MVEYVIFIYLFSLIQQELETRKFTQECHGCYITHTSIYNLSPHMNYQNFKIETKTTKQKKKHKEEVKGSLAFLFSKKKKGTLAFSFPANFKLK